MNHLVLGDGNMGRRHAKILRNLGDTCDIEDIHFDFDKFDPKKYDSVLICTWPESHQHYIMLFSIHKIPLFVEKPVQVSDFKLHYPGISMVACNWRFCGHINPPADIWPTGIDDKTSFYSIEARYFTKCNYAYFDLIHFVDYLWQKYGKPCSGLLTTSPGRYCLSMDWRDNKSTVVFDHKYSHAEIWINGVRIHERPCDMFIRQMEHWRACLHFASQSCNPVEMAAERTSWLIKLLASDAGKTTDSTPICSAEV